jgi:transcription elongation factor GreA
MPKDEVILTAESKKKLEEELYRLRIVRPRVEMVTQKARSSRASSKNSEYQKDRHQLALIDAKIAGIEALLKSEQVEDEVVLTPEGKKKLEEELLRLRTEELPQVEETIREALERGDPLENPEHQQAWQQLVSLNAQIAGMEALLKTQVKDEVILTVESKKQLEEELHRLRTVERARIAETIRKARAYGDLSENFEYQAARREQAILNGRIAEIEAILERAKVIEVEQKGWIAVGAKVTLINASDKGQRFEYVIVDANSADPLQGRISYNSPIGQALLKRKKGEQVEVRLPNGRTVVYMIEEISYS